MNESFVNKVGWYGAIAMIGAYVLDKFWLSSGNIVIILLNITGAIALVVYSFKKKAYPPGIIIAGSVALIILRALGVSV